MKNSNYRMMKFKHGCHKVIKFLMNKVFERETKKLMMLKVSVGEWFLKHSKAVTIDKKSVISGEKC